MKIKIIEFFNRESDGSKFKIVLSSIIGSICFPALLIIANWDVEIVSYVSKFVEMGIFILYLLICSLAIICKAYTLNQTTAIAEEAVRKVRVRLIDKLRRTELRFIETEKKGEIFARIVEDTEIISMTSANIANTAESIFASIAVFLYMATVSITGFVLATACIMSMYVIFFTYYFKIKSKLEKVRRKETDFLDLLNDTLSGFKEIKINAKKNNALFEDITSLSNEIERETLKPEIEFDKLIVLYMSILYFTMGVIIFIVPKYSHSHGEVINKLVTSVLFVTGLLGMVLRGTSVNLMANVGVENLEKLEANIDNAIYYNEFNPDYCGTSCEFKEIILDELSFQYKGKEDETLFTAGPFNLKIKQGETLFIVGGNGSGKSTLLKLMVGLYYPMAGGRIIVDDQTVTNRDYQSYRELFSTIFTDFHLFKKLYGITPVDTHKVKELLEELDVHRKTNFVNGMFTHTDLSTGQRKRLAYITAILEDKPVYVFDEWAADQDPIFRKRFYKKFLSDLKAMNKTIIVVTHDDRYFDIADRVIKLEEGKIVA